jgi:hypothetical protein
MGRTEFLTPTIRSEPWVGKRKPTKRAKWRSFYECMQECAQNLVDTADIVRDGDVTPALFEHLLQSGDERGVDSMSAQVNAGVLFGVAAIAGAAPAWVPVIWWKPQSLLLIRVPLLFASLSSLLQVMFVTLVAIGATSLGYSLGFCAVGISCSLFVILWAMCNPRTILLSLGAVISSSLTIAMWLFFAMLH